MKNENKNKLEFNVPYDIEAEKAVIACLIIDNSTIIRIMDELKFEHFYYKIHQVIYQAIINLYNDQIPADLITLADYLKMNPFFQEGNLSLMEYLNNLIDLIPIPSTVHHYAKIIINKYRSRSLISICQEIVSDVSDVNNQRQDVDLLLDRAQNRVFELSQSLNKNSFVLLRDFIEDGLLERLEALYNDDVETSGIVSGFVDLDRYTGGFQKGDLIIIAARPSMGKTALALNMLEYMALKQNKSVALFSLEMPNSQIINRLISMNAKIDSNRIRQGKFDNEEFIRITGVLDKLSKAKIFVDDSGGLTNLEIRSKVKRLLFKEKVDIIILDYLQLITYYQRRQNDNRQNEISEISRSLKNLAKEVNIPIIVLSQLSRMVENRTGDHRPRLSDLRDSGAIEQDADLVLFIYRDEYYYPDKEGNHGKAEIIISKHRNGPTGNIELLFDKQYAKFKNFNKYER